MSSAVSCQGLVKSYGSLQALGPLDLDIPAGSVFGLLGPNGAGKTTLLSLLAGLRHPTSGTANAGPRESVGYLEQDPRYYGWMTGRELLRMVGRLYGIKGSQLSAAAARACETAGMQEFADRRIGGYSGGMRQRLGLAQAIVHQPGVLLLDEPVSSLDPIGRRDLLEIIAGLQGSATVVLSTHILADVERVCDRVAILDHGKLVVVAAMNELLERYATPVFEIELESGSRDLAPRIATDLKSKDGIIGVDVAGTRLVVRTDGGEPAGRTLLGLLAGSGAAVERFEKRRPSLEEVFVTLVDKRQTEAA